jgi:hypothetical protein
VSTTQSRWHLAVSIGVAAAILSATARFATALCAPTASAILPASAIVGTTVVATVTGAGLADPVLTIFGEPGLAAAVQASSDTEITVRVDVDASAAPGERILFFETPGGSTGLSFTVNPPGGLVINDVSPPLITTQGTLLAATVSGAGLDSVTLPALTVSGAGVTVASVTPQPDGTALDLTFTVESNADLGTHAVMLDTPAGSATLQLHVQRPPPTIAAVTPAAIEVGDTVPLALTGGGLSGAAVIVTGSGVTATDPAAPDDTTLTATVQVDSAVTPSSEPRLLIVTTESGQATAELFIVPPSIPTVTSVAPGAGEPGTTIPVTLRGLRLSGASVSEASVDLSLQDVQVVDDETITLDVVIAPGAVTDVDHTLTVTTGAGSAMPVFRVITPGDPFISAVSPPFGNRGSTMTVFVRGVNLGLALPATGVDLSGPKITESNAMAIDNETVQATLAIGRTATLPGAFRVNVPGTLPAIDDVTPRLVDPGTTTPVHVVGTNFLGAGVLVTGAGAAVDNTAVDAGGTDITFDLSLAADAPADTRSVIVVTENGTAQCGLASDPAPPPLVPAQLVKTGARFEVSVAGYRAFLFDFSVGGDFADGLRTWTIVSTTGVLTLNRLDAVNIERAFRGRHQGYVRVRALSATNRLATSEAYRVRR